MRAARFYKPGEPLRIEEVPDPDLQPGAAIVRVLSTFVPPYFAEMIDGRVSYLLPPLPFTPGMDTIVKLLRWPTTYPAWKLATGFFATISITQSISAAKRNPAMLEYSAKGKPRNVLWLGGATEASQKS